MVMLNTKKSTVSKDPFAVAPLPKSHYHPSKQKNLSRERKKTTLSPSRSHKTPNERCHEDELFLKGSNVFSVKDAVLKEKPEDSFKFEESWDSSERPSDLSLTLVEDKTEDIVKSFIAARQNLKPTAMFTGDNSRSIHQQDAHAQRAESTLAKYIERFRNAQPMSREERLQKNEADQQEFWWLNSSPTPTSSSTPKDNDTKPQRTKRFTPKDPPSSYRSSVPGSKLTDISQFESSNIRPLKAEYLAQLDQDDVTRKLQERADRLLEQSSSSLNSTGPIVSTDGLGSMSSSSMGYSMEDMSFKHKHATQNMDKDRWRSKPSESLSDVTEKPIPNMSLGKPLHSKDDILYQWRLRRKMEMARERVYVPKIAKQHTTSVKLPSQNVKMDSKLDEFREKLSSHELGQPNLPLMSARIHFTPAPERGTRLPQQNREMHVCEETAPGPDISQIASPVLAKQGNKSCVDPHHHLMCDLLPCPHQDDYITDDSLRDDKTKKYRQFLKAEKPDVDREGQLKTQTDRKFSAEMPKNLKEDFIKSDETFGYNANSESCDKTKMLESDQVNNNDSEIPFTSVKVVSDSRDSSLERGLQTETSISEVDDSKRQKVVFQTQREHQDFDISDTDYEMDSPDSKLITNRPISSRSPNMSTQKQPDTSQINRAIGQVIHDRLFDVTSTSVISSIDSLKSVTQSSPSTHQNRNKDNGIEYPAVNDSPPDVNLKGSSSSKKADDDLYESDGEFPDDSLLKMLREQRSQYEDQLRYLDSLLEGFTVKDES